MAQSLRECHCGDQNGSKHREEAPSDQTKARAWTLWLQKRQLGKERRSVSRCRNLSTSVSQSRRGVVQWCLKQKKSWSSKKTPRLHTKNKFGCRLSLSMCRHTGQRQDSTHDVDIWRNSDGRFDTGYQKQRCTIGDLTRWEKGSKGGDDLTPDVKWRGPKEGDLTLEVRLPAGRGSKGDF